jgi:NAD(P)-dependent dehydrogenase (short-subunit alcohol dehydrogenase family)
LDAQGSGVIALISAPAGNRGRKSSYVCGAAKAAVTVLASGLRHRLANKGIRVFTILPGGRGRADDRFVSEAAALGQPYRGAPEVELTLERGS